MGKVTVIEAHSQLGAEKALAQLGMTVEECMYGSGHCDKYTLLAEQMLKGVETFCSTKCRERKEQAYDQVYRSCRALSSFYLYKYKLKIKKEQI